MNQQDKELIFKDLCCRLPYGVNVNYQGNQYELKEMHSDGRIYLGSYNSIYGSWCCNLEMDTYPIPYLRPLSSMTEEEFVYLMSIRGMNLRSYEIQKMMSENFSHPNRIAIVNTLGRYSHNIDWLNKNMFDYRGLIPKGLALEQHKGWYRTINKDR